MIYWRVNSKEVKYRWIDEGDIVVVELRVTADPEEYDDEDGVAISEDEGNGRGSGEAAATEAGETDAADPEIPEVEVDVGADGGEDWVVPTDFSIFLLYANQLVTFVD
jgi:hypothetical protein